MRFKKTTDQTRQNNTVKKLLLAGVALTAIASTAQAADLSADRTPIAAAVMAPSALWTGYYLGLHAGYGWGRERFTTNGTYQSSLGPTLRGSGALVGGQFGWNHQLSNNIVLGLEATLAVGGVKMSGSRTLIGVDDDTGEPVSFTSRGSTTMNWLTTLGPRLGYAFDRTLVYGKGGFAAAGFRHAFSNGGFETQTGNQARAGWFLGAGVEHLIAPNWTVKLEYNYLNFRSGYFATTYRPLNGEASQIDAHTVTIGFNYLFNAGKPADAGLGASAMMAQASPWTGYYLGLHAGYGWGEERFTTPDAFQANFGSPMRGSGALAGGQFGWNSQLSNNIVLGLEATLAVAGVKMGSSRTFVGEGLTTYTGSTTMNWLTTLGPRLGYAFDRTLVYGKGGFAAAGFRHKYTISPFASGPYSGTQARGGWFLGAGVEHLIAPNWTAKLEYNYLNFKTGHFGVNFGNFLYGDPSKIDAHTVTLGFNYLFNTGPAAVSARY